MKRALLFWAAVSLMPLSMWTSTLVAQPPDDSVYVKISPLPGMHPLASVVGVLHADGGRKV